MTRPPFDVERYDLPGLPARVALVTDLHARACEAILDALRSEKPELICVAGDLMELPEDLPGGANTPCAVPEGYVGGDVIRTRKRVRRRVARADHCFSYFRVREASDGENAWRFLREASEIAPTYYAPGNHEGLFTPEEARAVRRTGATPLQNEWVRLSCGVALGALATRFDPAFPARFARQTGYKLLLCHHPEYYEPYLRALDVDLILSGHAHGGQWRLLGRGLFAPGQGFWPKYTSGLYEGRLLVSRGLANTAFAPRIGNRKTLVIARPARG